MERIQSAIAKARAAREGTPEPRRPAPRSRTPSEQVKQAWSQIPRFDPKPRLLRKHRVTAFESGEAAAEFDRLRTRVMQRMQVKGWRRVAIISPSPQNGKSTVAANLSFSLAKQSHLSAMLIDRCYREITDACDPLG